MPTATFTAHLAGLAAQAQAQGAAAAAPGVTYRRWNLPTAFPLSTDVQSPAGIIAACARDDLNALVIDAYQTGFEPNAGRLGAVMAGKIAIDHMGAYERALHARHASAVRCRAWASARRAGHADLTYGAFGCVGRYVADTYGAGTATQNAPTG